MPRNTLNVFSDTLLSCLTVFLAKISAATRVANLLRKRRDCYRKTVSNVTPLDWPKRERGLPVIDAHWLSGQVGGGVKIISII